MNVDLAIHRMAFKESRSLAVAQVLVAKKRVELELKLGREQPNVDAVLLRMEEASRQATNGLDRRA